ncbi:MAG: hypothetical protein KIT68_03885 [Phycisphaeraceae bacterium]|nr:hypothetical protein [Phycisphaeraceae bacterium]
MHDTEAEFALALPLGGGPGGIGDVRDWLIEWKWDGVRAMLRCDGRGGAALSGRWGPPLDPGAPGVLEAGAALRRACVIDGELVAWRESADGGGPEPFRVLGAMLAARAQNDAPPAQAELFRTDAPVFMAFDLIALDGDDLRPRPLTERRRLLVELVGTGRGDLRLSPELAASDWAGVERLRGAAQRAGVEGLMLKRRDGCYEPGRPDGARCGWWKWRAGPGTIDAVLMRVRPVAGGPPVCVLGVWDGRTPPGLVPLVSTSTGLSNALAAELAARVGPIEPALVFEIAFESVARSGRTPAGVMLTHPRIVRIRSDKPAAQADRLSVVLALADR